MATNFQSAAKRAYWLRVLYSSFVDFAVCYIIAFFFNDTSGATLVAAVLIWIGFNAVWLLYGLLGVAKGAFLFFLFDRKARVAATLDQMAQAKMPKPMQYYADAEEYLTQVVKSDANNDAKLFAGASLTGLGRKPARRVPLGGL